MWCLGSSLQWLLLWSMGSRRVHGLQSLLLTVPRAWAQSLWFMALLPRHLPGPGIKFVSSALSGTGLTTFFIFLMSAGSIMASVLLFLMLLIYIFLLITLARSFSKNKVLVSLISLLFCFLFHWFLLLSTILLFPYFGFNLVFF